MDRRHPDTGQRLALSVAFGGHDGVAALREARR
jgi:hypothetical protein